MNWIQNIKAAVLCSGFMLICLIAKAQNLVPNGDFEYYTTCPVLTINGASIEFAFPWTSPSVTTTAMYGNRCDTIDNYSSVPITNGGASYQESHSGNGNAAIVFRFGNGYRDYMEVHLTDSLKAGHCYYVSFFVSLQNFMEVGCNNINAHLSDTFMHSDAPTDAISASQDILAFGNPIIMDTTGWFQVAGIYTAHGGEKYITIGDFLDDAQTDTLHQNTYDGQNYSTYYLDDVSVEEVNAQAPRAFAGNDTAINQNDSVFVGSLINGLSTQWFDGSGNPIAANVPGLWVHPSSSTSYVLQQTVCGFTSSDTVTVDVWPLSIHHTNENDYFSVYPNPTSGIVNVLVPASSKLQFKVTDVSGRQVEAIAISQNTSILSFKLNASPGVYFLRLINIASGATTVERIVLKP